MSWPTATLDSISEVVRGVTFSKADAESDPREGLLPVLRAGNIAETLNIESDLVYVDQGHISEKQRLRPKDIVICTSSGSASVLGKSAMLGQEWQGSFGAFLATVRTDSHVADPDFVGHYLRSPRFRAWASNSAGIGIKNIRASDLKKVEIPLPPLEEQKRIARILDQAAELCRLRTRALDKLSTLGQAIFHEMFGDPVTNPYGWNLTTLPELGTLDRGVSKHRPRNDPALLGGDHPLIQTGDVSRALDYITEYTSTYSDLGLSQSRKWTSGTVCITIAANIADTAILDFDACFPDSVVGFDSGSPETNFFIHRWFSTMKRRLENIAPAVAQKNINLKILRELPVIKPPSQLIEEYYAKERQLRAKCVLVRRAAEKNQNLFASLQHRAFKGEL